MSTYRTLSAKQAGFLRRLLAERVASASVQALIRDGVEALTMKDASSVIESLLASPRIPNESAITTPGVFETPDGAIFIVKPNRARTNLYAKRLVEIGGERLAESGDHVHIEFEYAPGAIFKLSESMRMDVERARELTVRYGRCIVCGRHLKDAKSVERGIGPVCIQSFRTVAA